MAKVKEQIIHVRTPKKTSQGNRNSVKRSSMNKHRKRNFKVYNRQGK